MLDSATEEGGEGWVMLGGLLLLVLSLPDSALLEDFLLELSTLLLSGELLAGCGEA
jgi:hypothetical protein